MDHGPRRQHPPPGANTAGPSWPPGRRELLLLGLVLLLAAGVRLAYLGELRGAPELRHPPVDGGLNLYWARSMVTGDWTPPPAARGRDPGIRATAYLRPPGYAFVLAGLYQLTGGEPLAIRALQMVGGVVAVALAWLLGRLLLGPPLALTWAALLGLDWHLVYFEGAIADAWLVVLLLLALLLALRAFAVRPGPWPAMAAAVFLGLAALVRPNSLAAAPLLAAWALWLLHRRGKLRDAAGIAAVTVAAGALVLAPTTLRNWRVEHRFVPVSANGGLTLYHGNNDDSTGFSTSQVGAGTLFTSPWQIPDIVAGLERSLGRPMCFTDASRELGRRARAWIATHPGRAARLALRRAVLLAGPCEIAHSYAPAADRAHSVVLRALPVGWPLALAGALVGVVVLLRRRCRGGWAGPCFPAAPATLAVAGLITVAWLASFLPFFVTSLYRTPMIPILLLGTAIALVQLALLARRDQPAAIVLGAAFLGLWLLARVPVIPVDPGEAKRHEIRGTAWAFDGDLGRAEAELRAAVATGPASWSAHGGLGAVLLDEGHLDEAEAQLRQALADQPADTAARYNLGIVLAQRGAWHEATAALAAVAAAEPGNAAAHTNLGVCLERLGRRSLARDAYRQALAAAPVNALAGNNLAWLEATAADPTLRNGEEAVAVAERLAAATPSAAVLDTLAAAYAEAGRFDDALTAARRARSLAAPSNQALAREIDARIAEYRAGRPHRER